MYASIRRFEGVDSETISRVAQRGYGDLRRKLSERPGFVAYETVIGADSYATITVFESWATAEESNMVARRWIAEHLADLDWPEPQVTAGRIYEEPGSHRPPFAPASPLKLSEHANEPSPLLSLSRVRGWLGKRQRA